MNNYFFADSPDEDADAFYGAYDSLSEESAGYYAEDAGYYAEDAGDLTEDAGYYAEDAGDFAEEAGYFSENAGDYFEEIDDFAEEAVYYADGADFYVEHTPYYHDEAVFGAGDTEPIYYENVDGYHKSTAYMAPPGGEDGSGTTGIAGLLAEDHLAQYNLIQDEGGADYPEYPPQLDGPRYGSSAAEEYRAAYEDGTGRGGYDWHRGDGSVADEDPTWMGEAGAGESTEIVDDVAGTYSLAESLQGEVFGEAAEGLREGLHEGYESAAPWEIQETMYHLLGTLTPAESFNFSKALRQIGRAGQQVLKDPAAAQLAKSVLPAAGAAIGTVYGGPVGTAIGGRIGSAAAGAFAGGRQPTASASPLPPGPAAAPPPPPAAVAATPPPPAAAVPPPAPVGVMSPPPTPSPSPSDGSTAAKQLFMLTQNPDILKTLLALALGAQGRTTIPVGQGAVPVAGVARMLSTLAGQAAEDAEQLSGSYGRGYEPAERPAWGSESYAESVDYLYDTLLAAENARLGAALR